MGVNVNKISYHVITILPDRDIAGIIDELRTVKESQVYLYFPDIVKSFRNTLNMQLIQSEGIHLGKDLTLISRDLQTRNVAKKIGIPTLTTLPHRDASRRKNVGETEKTYHEGGVTKSKMYDIVPPDFAGASYVSSEVFEAESDDDDDYGDYDDHEKPHIYREEDDEIKEEEPELSPEHENEIRREEHEESRPLSRERGEEFFEKMPYRHSLADTVSFGMNILGGLSQFVQKGTRRGIFFLVGGSMIAGIGIFVYVVLPKAEVRLEPKRDRIVFDLTVRVNVQKSGVDSSKNIIPGQLLESSVERTHDFLSSGRELREEHARGIIAVYNEYSSSPQTLVENTRFISQDGKLFRSSKTVVVPGASINEGKIVASRIDMEVIAQEAGEGHNIGPSTFSIPGFRGTPKYTAFYGKSSDSMRGGFIGEVEVVSADDLKQAEEKFKETLLGAVREDFRQKKPADFTLLDEAVGEEVIDLSSTQEAGDTAKSFSLRGKARVTGFVFDERDVHRLIDDTIQARISLDKEVIEGSKKLTYKEVRVDSAQGEMSMLVAVEEWIASRIDENGIIDAIKGKSLEETRDYLASHPALESARVTFSPFWIKRVPRSPDKIRIDIVRSTPLD